MQSIPNNSKSIHRYLLVNNHSFILVYYQPNEYQFHDSGIVEEDLSDETGSMEDGLDNQENQISK